MIAQVKEEHPEISIERLCELMGVSRSWYYERPTSEARAQTRCQAQRCHRAHPPGVLRLRLPSSLTAALKREGWSVNHKRVLRIMREESLLCQLKRRFVPTTDSAHAFGRYPNLIKDIEIEELAIRCGSRTSPTSGCPRTSATWQQSWTPTPATV
jgi:putative transposase